MKIDSSKLKAKLEKIKAQLPAKIESSMLSIGEKMQEDILQGAAYSYSPTWRAARSRFTSKPYFFGSSSGNGIMDAIKASPISLFKGKNGTYGVGVGHIPTLDSVTESQSLQGNAKKAYAYWRIFEFGMFGTRSGGSDTHHFVPGNGKGKSGEGQSAPGGSHYGVLPVHLFGDTFQYYKGIIPKVIEKSIRKFLKEIK